MTRDHLGLCRWESCGQSTLNLTNLVTGKQVASFKAGGSMTMPWETEKDNITVMCNCQDSIWMRLLLQVASLRQTGLEAEVGSKLQLNNVINSNPITYNWRQLIDKGDVSSCYKTDLHLCLAPASSYSSGDIVPGTSVPLKVSLAIYNWYKRDL